MAMISLIRKGKLIVRWGRKVMGLMYEDRQTAEVITSAVFLFKEVKVFGNKNQDRSKRQENK
jgi:hypothetical protein